MDHLVTFLPLSGGVPVWARHLSEAISAPRFDSGEANRRVGESPYAIEESYAQLHALYSSADHE